jgi:hypothetical protein
MGDGEPQNYHRTHADFLAKLHEQLDFLEASCRRYDEGKRHESIRLAQTLRVLLMHKPAFKTRSLVRELGWADMPWLSTSIPIPEAALGGAYALVGMAKPRGLIEWVPLCYADGMSMMAGTYVVPRPAGSPPRPRVSPDEARRLVDFDTWWTEPIAQNVDRDPVSRDNLIYYIANKDGGAHVDRIVPARHRGVMTGENMGWQVGWEGSDEGEWLTGGAEASIRQIAHEVGVSLTWQLNRDPGP